MYTEERIIAVDSEIERLDQWLRQHARPPGVSRATANGFDLMSANETISFAVYDYLRSKDRRDFAQQGQDASLGRATWTITCAMTRFRGRRRLYLRQLSTMGAMMLRALEMRQVNAMQEANTLREAREAAERKERQATPSPWGDSVCMGCGGEKRVWADMVRHTCARCGTPLGELPAPTTAT